MPDHPADADALTRAWAADAALVERVRTGESLAFQELFSQYRRLVYGLACRLLNDGEEARDLCQEVFLTAYRRLPTLREPEKLRSWLCRITVTRAYNVERSFRRRLRSATVSLEAEGTPELVSHAASADPERVLVSAETERRIQQALANLPFSHRTVVVLRDIEGLSYEEIAEAVDANLGTVKSRLARGREALREQLRDLLVAGRREGRS